MQQPVYSLLQKMNSDHVILAYNGEITSEILESVYPVIDKNLDENKIEADKKKKFVQILIEALQNVFHHQVEIPGGMNKKDFGLTGFLLKKEADNSLSIVTGNYIMNSAILNLKAKIDKVNSLSPTEIREYYRKSLAENELSEKGGAGLGIIEMAKKSGRQLKYEFAKIDDEFSFFSMAITIP